MAEPKTNTPAPAAKVEPQKPTITAEQWAKMSLEQKVKARHTHALSEEQTDQLEDDLEDEEHRRMLRELSGKRMKRALDNIRTIGDLVIHKPTAKQQEAIIETLQNAVNAAKERLSGKGVATFQLPE